MRKNRFVAVMIYCIIGLQKGVSCIFSLGIIKNGNLFVREPQSQVKSLIIEYLLVLSYAVFINEMHLFATFSYFFNTKNCV